MSKKLKKYVLMYIPTGDIIAYKKLFPEANKRLLISTRHDIYLSKQIISDARKAYNEYDCKTDYNIVTLKRYIKPSVREYFNYLNFLVGRYSRDDARDSLFPPIDAMKMIRIDFDDRRELSEIEFEVVEIQ